MSYGEKPQRSKDFIGLLEYIQRREKEFSNGITLAATSKEQTFIASSSDLGGNLSHF